MDEIDNFKNKILIYNTDYTLHNYYGLHSETLHPSGIRELLCRTPDYTVHIAVNDQSGDQSYFSLVSGLGGVAILELLRTPTHVLYTSSFSCRHSRACLLT